MVFIFPVSHGEVQTRPQSAAGTGTAFPHYSASTDFRHFVRKAGCPGQPTGLRKQCAMFRQGKKSNQAEAQLSTHAHFYAALAVRANATEEMKMKTNWKQEDGRITSQDSTAGSRGNVCSPETTELAGGVLQNQHKGQWRQEEHREKGLVAGTKPRHGDRSQGSKNL